MKRSMLAAVAALILSTVACSDDTPTTPTTPAPEAVTDTFTGTLTRNGAANYGFSVSASGTVTATISSLSDSSTKVGLSLGLWNGTACAIVVDNSAAVLGTNLYGQATGVGNLCVRIYDVGAINETLDYEVSVTHY